MPRSGLGLFVTATSAAGALAAVAGLGLGGCALPECESFDDCDPGFVCSADAQCVPDTRPPRDYCPAGGDGFVLLDRGLPLGAAHFSCGMPPGADAGPRFTSVRGAPAIVNGGSVRLELGYEGLPNLRGQNIVFGFDNDAIVYRKTLVDEGATNPMPIDLFALRTAPPGINVLRLAIDNGTSNLAEGKLGFGPVFEVPLNFIPVKGGDIQISISWDNTSDVDLHVFDAVPVGSGPDVEGERIFFGDKKSASGGELDLDSNVGCQAGDPQNENIYWPEGQAPTGEFRIEVHLFTNCATTEPTRVRVTKLVRGELREAQDLEFPADANDGAVLTVSPLIFP